MMQTLDRRLCTQSTTEAPSYTSECRKRHHSGAVAIARCGIIVLSCIAAPSLSGATETILTTNFDAGKLAGFKRSLEGDTNQVTLRFPQSPVQAGARSVAFTLNVPDTIFPVLRNEIYTGRYSPQPVIGAMGKEYIYRFNQYVPSSWPTSALPVEVAQLHVPPDTGEPWRAPVLGFMIVNDEMEITTRWDAKKISNPDELSEALIYSESIEKESWVEWRVEVRWSWGNPAKPAGYLRIYKNGAEVVNRDGPNCYNDKSPRYFKTGLYTRSEWAESAFAPAAFQIFVDEISVERGGDDSAGAGS